MKASEKKSQTEKIVLGRVCLYVTTKHYKHGLFYDEIFH